MTPAIKIVFLVLLVFFTLSFIGEKDKNNKYNYMVMTIIIALLTVFIFIVLK